jgi:small conductance mechanosensitive channel
VDRVIGLLRELGEELRQDPAFHPRILESEVLGVERLGESSVVVRVLLKTVPLEQFAVGREFRRRVLRAFAAAGIEIPFATSLPSAAARRAEGKR